MVRFVSIVLAAFCMNLFCFLSATAQDVRPADRAAYFDKMIDKKISCCLKKAGFRNSSSPVIRQEAHRAWLKQAYYREFKSELIQQMLSRQVEPKPYKVDYYLIKSFYKTVGH